MWQMALASALFLGTHLGISSTSARPYLVARLGETGYLVVYSLIALGTLSFLIWLYGEVPRYSYLWLPSPSLNLVPMVLMPVALILAVGGFMVKNPTNVGAEVMLREAQAPAELARGVTRITRHPFQWGVVLWAVSHMIANGDTISIVFCATFLVLSGAGTVLIDAKKARALGDAWLPYRDQTSNVPFAAIISGRNRLVLGELWLPLVVGIALYVALIYGHYWVGGVRIV